jgi:hypothetical protein
MPGSTITLGPVTPLDQLLDELSNAPSLHGGLCVGRPNDWTLLPWGDPRRNTMARRAIRRCNHCPVLARCSALLNSMPAKQRPEGTIMAGKQIPARTDR